MKIVELTGTCSAGGALTITGTEKVTGYLEYIIEDYVDGDTGEIIDISDLVYLVDFMFTGGPQPPTCL